MSAFFFFRNLFSLLKGEWNVWSLYNHLFMKQIMNEVSNVGPIYTVRVGVTLYTILNGHCSLAHFVSTWTLFTFNIIIIGIFKV